MQPPLTTHPHPTPSPTPHVCSSCSHVCLTAALRHAQPSLHPSLFARLPLCLVWHCIFPGGVCGLSPPLLCLSPPPRLQPLLHAPLPASPSPHSALAPSLPVCLLALPFNRGDPRAARGCNQPRPPSFPLLLVLPWRGTRYWVAATQPRAGGCFCEVRGAAEGLSSFPCCASRCPCSCHRHTSLGCVFTPPLCLCPSSVPPFPTPDLAQLVRFLCRPPHPGRLSRPPLLESTPRAAGLKTEMRLTGQREGAPAKKRQQTGRR